MSEVVFLFWPTNYLLSIELVGAVGEAMLRGLGVLFIMWNVPYSVAMWHPIHRTIPHFEAPELLSPSHFGKAIILAKLTDTIEFNKKQ
jgi:hypothetical protein